LSGGARTFAKGRSAAVAALAAAALCGAGCGGAGGGEHGGSGAGSEGAALYRAGSGQVVVRTKENLGGQVQVFFILTGAARSKPLAAAKECVGEHLDDAKAAFCFAFASRRALKRARIDRENGGMKRACWRAHWGRALSGDEDGSGGGPLELPGRC
jgi:hypothetical protein